MNVDVEILWRVELLLQSCVLLWSRNNVYFSPIWTQELAEVLLTVVGTFVGCSAGWDHLLVLDAISRRRHSCDLKERSLDIDG